jgi:DNA-binding CsgD family transcriptional regulator
MQRSAKRPEPNSAVTDRITDEQRRLLESLGEGVPLAEAARRMGLSLRTAERRLAEARTTLRATTNAQALIRAGGGTRGLRDERLTTREREILWLVGEGLRDDEIADQLAIAPSTVASLLRSAMAKLGVRTRTQAVTKLAEKA